MQFSPDFRFKKIRKLTGLTSQGSAPKATETEGQAGMEARAGSDLITGTDVCGRRRPVLFLVF